MVNKHKQKKKKPFENYGKSNKEINALIEKENTEICEEQEKEENGEGASALPRNADFTWQRQKESFAESVESGIISASSSEWRIGSDEVFITCLNCISENKITKPIKNYFYLFINTRLNQLSIRSHLVSQPNKKLKLNNEQSINSTNLSPITFGVNLPPR